MNKKLVNFAIAGVVIAATSTGVVAFADVQQPSDKSSIAMEERVVPNAKMTEEKVVPEADGSTTAPVASKILITGAKDTTVNVGDNFDPMTGVTAKDDKGTDLTKNIKVSGTVDTAKPGDYKLTYSLVDGAGQPVKTERTITVKDAVKPQSSDITIEHALKDGDKVAMGTGVDLNEGISARCAKHPDAKVEVKVDNGVNVDKVGEYPVTYTATCPVDGETKTETVKVKVVDSNDDSTQEVTAVNLDGAKYTEVNVGDNFNDMEGVKATDQNGNDITKFITVDGKVDTSKEGTYTIHYVYKNGKGKELCNVARTVVVRPEGAPLFQGIDNKQLKLNDKFDPMEGVKALDKKDGDITKDVKVDGTVDTTKQGKYTLTYTVKDSDGNATKVERIITVGEATTDPNAKPEAKGEDKKLGSNYQQANGSNIPKTGAIATSLMGVSGVGMFSGIALALRKRK